MSEEKRPQRPPKGPLREEELRRAWTYALIAVVSVCVIIGFYFIVLRFDGLRKAFSTLTTVLQPFIIGFVIAFLVNPMMDAMEKRIFGFLDGRSLVKSEKRKKVARSLASLLSVVILVGLVAAFFAIVLPQLVGTVTYFYEHLEEQFNGVLDWADQITDYRFTENINGARTSDALAVVRDSINWLMNLLEVTSEDMMSRLASGVISVGRWLVNFLIGMVVAYYVLTDKEKFTGQAKMILCSVAPSSWANHLLSVIRKANDIFYGFIVGKIIDSFIIGVICYISCLLMRMPYPVLVAVIIGVTNVIPIFGPYIGAVPTVILIFLTNPMKGIYFLIYVIVLQQIDGNLIGPKILGNSTGVSPFWVIVGIVIGGGLFGLPGMLIGVPTAALLYYLVGRVTRLFLRARGMPEDRESYRTLDHFDPDNGQIVSKEEMAGRGETEPKNPPYGRWADWLKGFWKKLKDLAKQGYHKLLSMKKK